MEGNKRRWTILENKKERTSLVVLYVGRYVGRKRTYNARNHRIKMQNDAINLRFFDKYFPGQYSRCGVNHKDTLVNEEA